MQSTWLQISERIAHVPKSGIREIFDTAQSLSNVINLGIGEPDFSTPDFICSAAKESIDSKFTRYTPNAGIPELREAIRKKLRRENRVDVDPGTEIIITSGATQAIFLAMNCILDPGDEVVLPTPLFSAYKHSARLAGGVPIEAPVDEEDGFSIDHKEIERRIGQRTRIVVLNSPCNPTGAVFARKEIERVCQIAADHNLYLISDEIYEKFLYDGAEHEEFLSRMRC